ncbi:endochitinase A-like isoform X2 [Gambusia affinis]|uniref:endochitinase A-like isoform X2 n=1 Tax=Gambusia affinis TaxID=33528 RepID=UPI001CDCC7BF|nr:endochitinase A-like isoform X2 [Gambusia affinis]
MLNYSFFLFSFTAHCVALPEDGSPTLEEHLADGKDIGKVGSNVFQETISDNMVSGDHGEVPRCSSPPQSVDCSTSSSVSSSQDDWASSFSGSCISSSSGSSSLNDWASSSSCSSVTSYSKDEVGSDWTTSYGSISTTSCSPTVDRPYAELEMTQKFQEDIFHLTSLEEPILSPDDSRPFGVLQRHQVGLVGDATRMTSVTGKNGKRTMDSDSEEEPPAKRTRDSDAEEEPSAKRTRDSDDVEEAPPAKRTRVSVSEEEPSAKRTRDSDDVEEAPPAKRTRVSVSEEEPSAKRTRDSDDVEEAPPAKRTRDSVSEVEPSAKSTGEHQPRDELPSKRTRDSGAEEEIPPKISRNSDHEEEPVLSPSTNVLCEDSFQSSPDRSPSPMSLWGDHLFSPFGLSPMSASEDPILSSPVFSPSPRLPCEGPIVSVYAISPPISEDPILSSPVLSRPPSTACEDPIASSPVVSTSPATYCKIPSATFPCFCVWMKSQMDREEEPIPSTSGIGSDGIRGRESPRQVWFRPHYDLSSDDSD